MSCEASVKVVMFSLEKVKETNLETRTWYIFQINHQNTLNRIMILIWINDKAILDGIHIFPRFETASIFVFRVINKVSVAKSL